jgi:hypothetical protein
MKSRDPPEAMNVVKPLASRYRSNSTIGWKPTPANGRLSVGCTPSRMKAAAWRP